METAADQLADQLESNVVKRDKIIRLLRARVRGEETTTNDESNVTTDVDEYNINEEGEMSPTEEERTDVIQDTYSDDFDYAKAYDKYYGIRNRNPDEPMSPPSPIYPENMSNPDTMVSNPDAPLVSTPPNDRPINIPETPSKNKKSPVVISFKKEGEKKRPSPIKYPTGTDQGEQSEGKDVPLSRLPIQDAPQPTTRRETRQDLRIKLNSMAPKSAPKLVNDRGPPSSRLRRNPAPWIPGCAPKCSREHQHQPFLEGQAPRCPEIPRSQWQRET